MKWEVLTKFLDLRHSGVANKAVEVGFKNKFFLFFFKPKNLRSPNFRFLSFKNLKTLSQKSEF